MILEYEQLLNQNHYSKISIRTYMSTFNNFIDFINRKTGYNLIEPTDNLNSNNIDILINNAEDYNDTLPALNSKLKTFTLIKSIIKNAGIKTYKIQKLNELEKNFKKLKAARDDKINKNLKSLKFEPSELNDLIRIFFTPIVQNKLTNVEKFIISLYILMPPLRNNFYKIKYYTNELNFINDDDFYVKIFENKMVVSRKILKVKIDNDIALKLSPYQVSLLKNFKNKEFITNYNPITFNEKIQIIATKAFGKKFTINDFRHLFISSLNLNKFSNEQLRNIAYQMNQQQIPTFLSYRKFK